LREGEDPCMARINPVTAVIIPPVAVKIPGTVCHHGPLDCFPVSIIRCLLVHLSLIPTYNCAGLSGETHFSGKRRLIRAKTSPLFRCGLFFFLGGGDGTASARFIFFASKNPEDFFTPFS